MPRLSTPLALLAAFGNSLYRNAGPERLRAETCCKTGAEYNGKLQFRSAKLASGTRYGLSFAGPSTRDIRRWKHG